MSYSNNEGAKANLLAHFGLGADTQPFARGVNAEVYALPDERVLKVYKNIELANLNALKDFYDTLSDLRLPFALPSIEQVGRSAEGLAYSIETMLAGREMRSAFGQLDLGARTNALQSYFAAAHAIGTIEFPNLAYGELLEQRNPISSQSWGDYLTHKVEQKLAQQKAYLSADIPRLDMVVEKFAEYVIALEFSAKRCLVHGDYFPSNVLIDEFGSVTAVIDFSSLTCVGDSRVDKAAALIFLESAGIATKVETDALYGHAEEKCGDDLMESIPLYKIFYALLFSGCKESDPHTYQWVRQTLLEAA